MPGAAKGPVEKARKHSGKLAFFLAGLDLVLALLGWFLPKAGQSLLLPGAALVLVGLAVTAVTASVFARRAGRPRATGYLIGGIAVTVLAFFWTTDAVLPLRVLSVESRLNQLENCIRHDGSSTPCSAHQESNAPLIGQIAKQPNRNSPVFWPAATFLQAAGRLREFDTSATSYGPLGYGLLYDANAGNAAEIPNICLRHCTAHGTSSRSSLGAALGATASPFMAPPARAWTSLRRRAPMRVDGPMNRRSLQRLPTYTIVAPHNLACGGP